MYTLILHGRRRSISQLQKWRNLSVSLNPSAFSSSAYAADVRTQDSQKGQTFTVSYLIDSLGFTTKLAESISTKVTFEKKTNPDSVLSLLRSYGFTVSQISTIITTYPHLLIADAEKFLAPKLKLLQSRAASTSELTKIVSQVPELLRKDRAFSVYYDFVKEIMEADKGLEFKKLSHSLPQQGQQENKLRNLSVLRDLGLPQKVLFTLLVADSPHICGRKNFEKSLKKVIEMGFDPATRKFIQALRIIQSLSDKTIEEKVSVYTRLGFCVDDVWEMFKRWPNSLTFSEKKINQTFETLEKCGLLEDEVLSVVKKFPQCLGVTEQNVLDSVEAFLELGFSKDEFVLLVKRLPACIGYSVESVKKKIGFVVKQMNWPLRAVVSIPQVVGYSMEKRIVPRCNVVKALISKGMLGTKVPPMSSVLVCTNEVFLNRYVRKHDDDKKLVAELMAIFTGMTGKIDQAS